MITSKERAKLRGVASLDQAICQIGKEGLTNNCIESINDAVKAREIVKISVLQTCSESAKELASKLIDALDCDIVSVCGRKIVIYRLNPELKKHALD